MNFNLPPEPKPGDRISATMFAQLIRVVRAIIPREGPNIKLKTTPNGTFFSGSAASVPRVIPRKVPGCFELVKDEDGDQKLINCFFRIEQVAYSIDDLTVQHSWAGKFTWLEVNLVYGSVISPLPSVVSGDLSTFKAAAKQSLIKCVIPLYKFAPLDDDAPADADLSVEIDLRAIPTAQAWTGIF